MKIQDFYKAKSISKTQSLYELIEVLSDSIAISWRDSLETNESRKPSAAIVIKTVYDPYIDGNRCKQVSTVWYKNKPFMLYRVAGRSGRDFQDLFITDFKVYKQALKYIYNLCLTEEETNNLVKSTSNIKNLDYFYGEKFSLSNLTSKL